MPPERLPAQKKVCPGLGSFSAGNASIAPTPCSLSISCMSSARLRLPMRTTERYSAP